MSTQPDESLVFMLGEVRGDVKHILAALANNKAEIERVDRHANDRIDRLGDRVDVLESWKWKLIGAATVAAPAASIAITYILGKIGAFNG